MLKQLALTIVFATACLTGRPSFAQSSTEAKPAAGPEEQHFYHLDFVVKEVDAGKTINSRSYSIVLATNDHSEIRSNARLPIPTGQGPGGGYQQIEVGVSIDCYHAQSLGNRVELNVKAEISSLGDSTEKTVTGAPIIRANNWSSNVIVPLKQPTTIFSSDEPSSKRKMQLEITATPIK